MDRVQCPANPSFDSGPGIGIGIGQLIGQKAPPPVPESLPGEMIARICPTRPANPIKEGSSSRQAQVPLNPQLHLENSAMSTIGKRFGPLVCTGFALLALAAPLASARAPTMRVRMPPGTHHNCLACHGHRSSVSLPMNLAQPSFQLPLTMGRMPAFSMNNTPLALGNITPTVGRNGAMSRSLPFLVPGMPTNPSPTRMTLPACCLPGTSPMRMRPVR